MKMQFLRILRNVGLLSALVLVMSCSNRPKQQDTKNEAEEHNDAKFDNTQNNDAKFLVDAAEINLEEIRLGQLAQNHSMAADVKKLGKMMEEGHTKAQKELSDLADKKQITIPKSLTDNGESDYKKLQDEKGKDFDKKYCDMMVQGHKDAIDKFEKASKDVVDTDIKAWASAMLPALREHLDQSITCQHRFENKK